MADTRHDLVPLPLFGGGIVDQHAMHVTAGEVAAVIPDLVTLDAGNDEEVGRDPLIDDSRRRLLRSKNAAGETPCCRRTACTVRSAPPPGV
jgi:hypothetical protein